MPRFEDLEDRLLRGGVAHRHARRFMRELSDHYDDAVHDARTAGLNAEDAQTAARARLGTVDDLAHGMIARPELRALGARYPRAWNGVGPAAMWAALMVATVLVWVTIYKSLQALDLLPPGGDPSLTALQGPADTVVFLVTRIAPVLIGAGMLALALRQRLAIAWPLAGAALVAVIAGSLTMAVVFSVSPDKLSQLSIGVGISPTVQIRIAAMFALMLTPLLFRARLRRFSP